MFTCTRFVLFLKVLFSFFYENMIKEAEKILSSASTTIQNETNKAKEELRQQMSDIIIDTTQKILGDEISKEKHEEILKKAAEEL